MSRAWSLMHPADIAQTKAEILARQRDRARGTAMCAPNRVYDALNHDTGFDHAREPVTQLLIWDKARGRYRRLTPDELALKQRQVVVHSQTRRPQAGNRQSGGSAR